MVHLIFGANNSKYNPLLYSMVLLLICPLVSLAQSGSFGNTFIFNGTELAVHGVQHSFLNGSSGVFPGKVATMRSSPIGYFSFVGNASWTGASDNAHVDGYVKVYQTTAFTFPIGDDGTYRPVTLSGMATAAEVNAAYFKANPSSAITSNPAGGDFAALPSGAPFSTSSIGTGLTQVSIYEYWDINGSVPAKITLSWGSDSNVGSITANNLSALTIVGWNGTSWQAIPSSIDNGSSLTNGTITTNSTISPDTYNVYTLGRLDQIAELNIKVLLQGALFASTTAGIMRAGLGSGSNIYIPLDDPYTNSGNPRFKHFGSGRSATTTTAVLTANTGTNNAIVDWVFIELRNASDPSVVLETRAALLQRDGDVVDPTDGTSPLGFPGAVGSSYYVAVKHRNHLGAMTASALAMTSSGITVDFRTMSNADVYHRPPSSSVNYDGYEMVTVNGFKALWAGNSNADTKVKYQGPTNDNALILNQALGAQSSNPVFNYDLALGYYSGDINMDGKVKYQGPGNDPSFIFQNVIINFSLNSRTNPLYNYDLFIEQIP